MLAETTPETKSESRLQNPQLRAYAALALGVLCIGFSAIFTKWAGVDGPVSGFYRVAIATVVLALPYALVTARKGRSRSQLASPPTPHPSPLPIILGAALAGFFFAGDLGLWNTSLFYTSAANATLLGNLSTIWVALGAMLFFHAVLRRRFWTGMTLALVGVLVIMGRDVLEHPNLGWGDLLAVGSSIFYASYLLNTRQIRQRMDTLSFMWLSSASASVVLLAYCLVRGLTLTGFSTETWLALLGLAIISHVIGWLAINYSLGHLHAPIASVTLLSQPVITALLAVPLLHEAISAYQIVGGALVLVGIYVVNRR
jgi:drug/metabolite transporter (DMT)-like permease